MGKESELLEASRSGNATLVEKLLNQKLKRGGPLASLRRGPGVNVQGANGYSALHLAALNGHREIAVILLQHEASPNIPDSTGSTPLHLAAWAGHADVVRVILSSPLRNVQVNATNKNQETALHCGAQYGHSLVVNLLLEHGADPSIRNLNDETALDLAALYGRLETVELLLRTHPELAVVYRSSNSVSTTLYKVTPLHAASRNGHKAVVDVLLRSGLPPSLRTPAGSPLHEAALCGKVDVVKRLLESGIDLSITDFSGKTALQIAQQIQTPVAQEIANLIQTSLNGSPRSENLSYRTSDSSPLPTPSVASLPHDTASMTSAITRDSTFEATTDSYITLPRRNHSRNSSRSQFSDSNVYEIPPPPRSLPWLEQDTQTREGHSSSQCDLLDVNRAESRLRSDGLMSRSFDERTGGDLMSLSTISCPPCDAHYTNNNGPNRKSPFCRTSHARHSVDHYLPMTKVSPTPPQKPPRKNVVLPTKFDTIGRGQRSRQTVHGSSSGYELVYLARTGSREEGQQKPSFRIQSQYVDMKFSQGHGYENVSQATPDELYDIPRSLGGDKSYENVGRISEMKSELTTAATPVSPSHIVQPPTPDHPPPPPHLAEKSIHEKMRPLSSELKRKSRDIETETEEEIFLACTNPSGTPGSGSVSLSLSDNSTDNIEEVTSDKPFAVNKVLERPKTLKAAAVHDLGDDVKPIRRMNINPTILSPFDEQEEWAKINEILGSLNTDTSPELKLSDEMQREIQNRFDNMNENRTPVVEELVDIVIGRPDTVSDWLLTLGLPQYLSLLVNAGFDDIDFLGDGILDDSALKDIDVADETHKKSLIEAAEQLTTPVAKIRSQEFRDVEEWLKILRLECYCENFRKNLFLDMERVKKIWECELNHVLEIKKTGHVKRILASLRSPENLNEANEKIPQDREILDLKQITSDLQKISTSIAKLDSEIALKMESCENVKSTGTMGRRKSRPAPAPPAAGVSQGGTTTTPGQAAVGVSSLVIREPSELVLGMPKTLPTQWRHQPQALIDSLICYEAEYMGSTLVKELQGRESTMKSIEKLKKKYENRAVKSVPVILGISYAGVQFLERRSREPVCQHEIRNIHCACQDAADLTHFAYITKDHSTQDHFCHVFRVPTMDLARDVCLTLGQAFEVAYQLSLREGSNDTRDSPEQPRVKEPRPVIPKKPSTTMKPGSEAAENETASHVRSQSVTGDLLETPVAPLSKSSSTSSCSLGSGRAPLATKDEL